MNSELELKLQAYLDGELTASEARQVEASLVKDSEARSLLQELKMVQGILAGNEPERTLPNPEFHWSMIQRRMESAEGMEEAVLSPVAKWKAMWRRYLAPAAGFAAVLLLGFGTVKFYDAATRNGSARHYAEIEDLSDETGSYSFRSQSENMFVVWVYDRDQEKSETERPIEEEVMPQ
ncbi:MAG TPA: hypothetical protein VGE41_12005 [Verrucomicrobiae bacterium]|jgi:anti-sigma factor RsiW